MFFAKGEDFMPSSSSLQNVRKASLYMDKQFELIIHNGKMDGHWSPGEVIGPVIRDFYAIKYCTEGCGKIVLNDVSFFIKAGQCYVATPGDIMIEEADMQNPWSHTWITFNGIKAPMLFNNIGISVKNPVFSWLSNDEFLNLMNEAISICHDISESSELIRTAYAYHIFHALTNHFRNQTGIKSSLVDNYVNQAIYFMETNYSSDIKISDIAANLGLNRSYFYTIFKEQTNLSPQEYLTRLRMSKACELFSFPNATVASVANSLNYQPSVFFKHFNRIVGMSPSKYKQNISALRRLAK